MGFYNIVFIISMIFAIFILTTLGLLLLYGKYTVTWPPDVAECPDYWTVSKEGLCKPNPAVGNVGSANCGPFDPNKIPVPGTGRFSGPTSETAPGDAQIDGPRCMRQRKAHRCGFYWDGISDLDCGGPTTMTLDPSTGQCGPGCQKVVLGPGGEAPPVRLQL